MIIFLKMLTGHLFIGVISCFILFLFGEYQLDNHFISIIAFTFTVFLYIFNGYLSTSEKTNWYYYFSVAIIGILFWFICYLLSSGNTNYKQNNNAGLWFIYELYIIAKFPLEFLNPTNYSLKLDLISKFIFPILFSSCQFIGSHIKIYKIKNS